MKYEGAIADAIGMAKAKGAIFVVYIEGKDEKSVKITELINSGELGTSLEQDHFVAIKLEAGSMPHQQFGEIYKNPPVPSIYFIGKEGKPLDIITGDDDSKEISRRIQNVLTIAGITPPSTPAGSSSETSTLNSQNVEHNENFNYVCENGVCTLTSKCGDTNIEEKSLEQEQKMQRAKELLEKKKLEKEEKQKEEEIRKEMERRQVGQSVQQLKRWQKDQELKQMVEDRNREKREDQLAREKVLAQIAQDRADKQKKATIHIPPTEGEAGPSSQTSNYAPRVQGNMSRIQFKLPDGSSICEEFSNTTTLQTVIDLLKSEKNIPFTSFKLSTMFPRVDFSPTDYAKTLLDLQLCPTAVVLVLPLNTGTVVTSPGSTLSTFIWNLFAPIINVLGYLKRLIFGGNTTGSGGGTSSQAPVGNGHGKRPPDGAGETRQEGLRKKMRDSTVIRRQGNVARLADRRDSDDEGNTWNGNSTQQM